MSRAAGEVPGKMVRNDFRVASFAEQANQVGQRHSRIEGEVERTTLTELQQQLAVFVRAELRN